MSPTTDETKLQNLHNINWPDIRANVAQNVCVPLPDENVIVEEISQDATHEWLDSFKDAPTKCTTTNDEMTVSKTAEALQRADLINSTEKVVCTCCGKSFISKNKLSWHMRMHDKNRKRYICPAQQCGRIYASKQSYDQHYKRIHMDAGLSCKICQKIFSAKQTLEIHMRYHNKEFPYQCNLCPRTFAQKGHLTQHIEVKHENLRYVCTYSGCDKVFQNSVSLRNHCYTHTSMPFKCNHCDKEFPQKNKLKAHLWHKHSIEHSLEDLEKMRQFNIIRTRHAFVKVQTTEAKECSQNRDDSSDVDVEAE